MLDEGFWFFALSCIGFGFIPGPAMLQTVSLTLQSGRRAGLLAAFGILLGGMMQVSAVALGAAALLQASPAAYQVMKFVGGLYLIWLGIQRMSAPMSFAAPLVLARRILWTSALIEATNPKSALFYLSFLLPFVKPEASMAVGWQLLLLGALANLLFSVADVICVFIAWPLRQRMQPGGQGYRWAQVVAGSLFIVLGVVALVSR